MILLPSQASMEDSQDSLTPVVELWASRSPADPPCHPHYASLCRSQHRGLEDTAQEIQAAQGQWEVSPLGVKVQFMRISTGDHGKALLKANMGGILGLYSK